MIFVIHTTDRSKRSKAIFFAVSLFPLLVFSNIPFKWKKKKQTKNWIGTKLRSTWRIINASLNLMIFCYKLYFKFYVGSMFICSDCAMPQAVYLCVYTRKVLLYIYTIILSLTYIHEYPTKDKQYTFITSKIQAWRGEGWGVLRSII